MVNEGKWLDFSNSKLSLRRSVWTYSKVQLLVGAVIRNHRVQLRYASAPVEYLNVGCGPVLAQGFCNLDYSWFPGVLCWDITKGIPLPNSSIRGIFTEHCLEHLCYAQCLSVLRDFRRMLRPGGVARIVVPDGELYCRLYVQAKEGRPTSWPYPTLGRTPMAQVNRVMREHGHQFIYDYETLHEALLEAGFAAVHREKYQQGREAKLLIDQEGRSAESLYVEGIA